MTYAGKALERHISAAYKDTCSDYAKINYEENADNFTTVLPCPCFRQPCDHVREREPQFRSCGTWGVAGVLIRLHQCGNRGTCHPTNLTALRVHYGDGWFQPSKARRERVDKSESRLRLQNRDDRQDCYSLFQ